MCVDELNPNQAPQPLTVGGETALQIPRDNQQLTLRDFVSFTFDFAPPAAFDAKKQNHFVIRSCAPRQPGSRFRSSRRHWQKFAPC
jgi:hypothetical protein